MPKRILVLVGSPRRDGNTETLADAFIEGAREGGNTVVKYSLRGKTILPCVDCRYCYTHDGCARRDDMDEVYSLLSEAEVLVLASPVYFYGFPGPLKAVFDRLHNPVRNRFPIRAAALLTVCADEGEAVFAPIGSTYRAIADYLHWEDLGVVAVDRVEERGAIAGNRGLTRARALGRSIT